MGQEFVNIKLNDIEPKGNNMPESEITQKFTLLMGSVIIIINYISSLKDSGLIYKWIEDTNFQQYVLEKSNTTNNVTLSSQEIVSLFRCQIRD